MYFCDLDFFYLNIEQQASTRALEAVNMRMRSTYVLLKPDGTEQARWFGPLTQNEIVAQVDTLLAENR